MNIPEKILDKQLCSECNKYLSWGPVKIYPSRAVKCGRCSEDEDMGVESPLYAAVIRNMNFPCVNRYDGCDAILSLSQMKIHEATCQGGVYDCFLCSDFKGGAYDLNLHCRKRHQKESLLNSEFGIDFSRNYNNEVYFYAKGTHLFFVNYNYDSDVERLTLELKFLGKLYKGNMFYSFRIYSIEKELMCRSKPTICSVVDIAQGLRTVVNVTSLKFPKNLAICYFSIHDEPEISYIENIPVIDSTAGSCIIKCAFRNMNDIDFEEPVYFPAVYYFKDIEWRVYIKRKLSLTDYTRKFGLFLQWDTRGVDRTCKVSAIFSLLTWDSSMKISKSFVKKEYNSERQSYGLMLHNWNYVMEPISGFVNEGNLNVEITLRIYSDDENEDKCHDCYRNCVYCK